MIRDAIHGMDDTHSYLGHSLHPKVGGVKKADKFYGPDVKQSRHLEPHYVEGRYHEMHSQLSHAHDDQHDIEPVHYHEHAILKASKTADHRDVKGLSLRQREEDKQHVMAVEGGHMTHDSTI